jgi:hypothetical protein
MLNSQTDLIGQHPVAPDFFFQWLACNDMAVTKTKCHRSLTAIIPTSNTDLIDWLGKKLFLHHHSAYRIQKLKQNYKKLGFSKYAKQHRKLPKADKTKKGNATEILLTEYVESCLQKQLIKVFKLRYNPNVDQAIKGDDTLMVDVLKGKKKDKIRMYLGEAKFRKTPTKTIVETITKSLEQSKNPLSYSFLVDELGRDASTESIADLLDKFLIEQIKGKGDLISVGLLFSNTGTHNVTEANLSSKNPNMIFISIGIDTPEDLIKKAFTKANYYVRNPLAV